MNRPRTLLFVARLLAGLWLAASAAAAQELAPAPQRFETQANDWPKSASVNPLDRAAVVSLYREFFVLLPGVASGWNGNTSTCAAGTTTTDFRNAVLDRVNVYRALAGLPGNVVQMNATATTEAQEAALMMSRNNSLSHAPPSSWACYTATGYSGAASSNLALGVSGTSAIDLYMDDPGSGNAAAGHRRWVLFPPRIEMGTGDITSGTRSNALKVFGASGTRPATPNGVAWPPRGFVPYPMLPRLSNRWSLSYPGANFAAAQVTMSVAGQGIPVTLETQATGYGDNTLVWRPRLAATGVAGVSYSAPAADTTYTVTVANVSGSGVPSSFTYTVTVIDPDAAAPPPPVNDLVYTNAFE